MDPFEYEPINLEGHSFRLLRLCKGDFGNVRCEIIHAYVDDESLMEYEALSYTWGGNHKAYEIEMGESMMAVTWNLSLALRNLRKTLEDRILWVDAICIDQNNAKERGHQVRQMASIYAKATRVLIWLGPATPETDLVLDTMSQFEKEASKYACKDWKISDERWQRIASSVHLSNKIGTMMLKQGLGDLLTRAWFDRVWIIQEVVNARAARVICGTKSVLARTFALFPYLSGIWLSEHCQAILDIMPGPTRKQSWWAQSHDLNTLLHKFRRSHASDPRDKVYALLGISSDRDSESFPVPDYEKTDNEVAQYVIRFLLQVHTGTAESNCLRTWTLEKLMQHPGHVANEACIEAASHGKTAIVKALLYTGKANPNYKTVNGETPLLRAAEEGHEAIVKYLIGMDDVKIDYEDNDSTTPLLLAVKNGHFNVVKLLVESGKEYANFDGPFNWDPLLHAAINGHNEMVRYLIERGKANINAKNQHGQTPLLLIARGGYEATLKYILDTCAADLNVIDNSGWDPLCAAAVRGHEAVVHMLLQAKDANASTSAHQNAPVLERALALELLKAHKTGCSIDEGQTWPLPLLWALRRSRIDLFELFLKSDLGLSSLTLVRSDAVARYIIKCAAQMGLESLVKRLLSKGENELTHEDHWAMEALRWAVTEGDSAMITLINTSGRADALFDGKYRWPETAARRGHEAVFEQLLRLGFRHQKDREYALLEAAGRGDSLICQLLLKHGDIDANCASHGHPTSLQLAAEYGHVEVVKVLLDTPGIDVEAKTEFWEQTPLSLAAKRGHADVVKLLLLDTPGIDVEAKDELWGQTPLSLAAERGHADVVKLLLENSNVNRNTRDDRTGLTLLDHAQKGRGGGPWENVCEVLDRYGISALSIE